MNNSIYDQPQPLVPPIPARPPAAGAESAGAAAFARDYRPYEAGRDPAHLVDRLLKRPGQVAWEVCAGRRERMLPALLAVVTVALLGYGVLVGSFSGGWQYVAAPLKVLGGLLASALICLPSLYIFSCLTGNRLALPAVAALLTQSLSITGILLAGFAPVAWIFAQSTHAPAFMGALHWAFWLCAFLLGARQLRMALAHHNEGRAPLFGLWCVIFLVVVLQMSTALRPVVGAFDGWRLHDKQFFLEHWGQTITGHHD